MSTPSPGLSIAEAAQATGLSADTLRYYERDGLLLQPVARSATGHRRYSESDLRWIELVTCLRATGMPIRDVRRYAELVRGGEGNETARLALLHAHKQQVLVELAEVTRHLGAIDRKIGIYEDKLRRAGLDLERAPTASVGA
ncbi:MerR family transcriptional regulator [Nocardioides sp. SYSU D00038]|uniref:MerR family transcriptional regulator n=1 Tax=Nocardioides sp. SYSU D00038 TaxID=2812554 RepID=UPI001967B63F|nr:MerR family transcriptional regulator [Nocardioides sp. SYSU D00038]